MSAPVNMAAGVWGDARFDLLARAIGVDRYSALGRMAALWAACVGQDTYYLTAFEIAVHLNCDESEVVPILCHKARLAEETPEGIRIRGTAGRIEWLAGQRDKARKGGAARAKGKRNADGTFVADTTNIQPESSPNPARIQPGHQPESSPIAIATATATATATWIEQAQSFRLRRNRLKKSQVDLSKALVPGGVERKQLRAWEAGQEQPDPPIVERWDRVLTTWEARAAEAKAQEPPSDHRDFVAWFDGRFAKLHNGARPTWDGRTGQTVKALLAQHGITEVKRRAGHMFDSIGQWPVSGLGDANIATLRAHFDRFVAPRPPTPSQDSRGQNTPKMYGYRDARDIDPSTY